MSPTQPRRRPGLAAALALLGCAAAHAACPPPPAAARTVEGNGVQAAWWPEPATLAVAQPFVLHVQLCPADAVLLRVDAQMPEHRHGMNYRPSVQPLGLGRWRAEGLLWHMSGRWELRLDVQLQGGSPQRLLQPVVLP